MLTNNTYIEENIPKSSFSTLFFLSSDESLILDSYLEYYNHIKHTTFHLVNQNNQLGLKEIAISFGINIDKNHVNPKNLSKQTLIKAFHEIHVKTNKQYSFPKFNPSVTSNQNKQLPLQYNITSRQFNSIKIELKGIINSTLELREQHFKELQEDIKTTTKQINSWCKKQTEIIESLAKELVKSTQPIKKNKNKEKVEQNKKNPHLSKPSLNVLTGLIKSELIKINKEYQQLITNKPKENKSYLKNSHISYNKSTNDSVGIIDKLEPFIDSFCQTLWDYIQQSININVNNNKSHQEKDLNRNTSINITNLNTLNNIQTTNITDKKELTQLKEVIKNKIIQYGYTKIKEKSLSKKLKYKTKKYNKILWDKLTNQVSICFGGKKLFHQQFLVNKNNKDSNDKTNNLAYLNKKHADVIPKTHEDWLKQWQFKRHQHMNMVGAKAETQGNQSCIARINRKIPIEKEQCINNVNSTKEIKEVVDNLTFDFDIRRPDEIINHQQFKNYPFYQNKYLQLKEIDFNEFNIILETMLTKQTTTTVKKEGLKTSYTKKEVAEAITYKISKNQKQSLNYKGLTGYTITFTVNTPKASLIKAGKKRFSLSKVKTTTTNHLVSNDNNKNIKIQKTEEAKHLNNVNTNQKEWKSQTILDKSLGVVGIDLNYDHVVIAETNRHGNLVNCFNLFFNSKVEIDKNKKVEKKLTKNNQNSFDKNILNNNDKIKSKNTILNQLFNESNYNFSKNPINHHYHIRNQNSNVKENMLGNVVKIIIEYAKVVGKPIVIEDLDFSQKKQQLRQDEIKDKKYNTMLNSFCYGLFRNFLERNCYKFDIELIKVNPAYTSLIGLVNYTKSKNLTVHQAAALAIGRRGQFSKNKTMSQRDYSQVRSYIEKIQSKSDNSKQVVNKKSSDSINEKKVLKAVHFFHRGQCVSLDLPAKPEKVKGSNQALKKEPLFLWKELNQAIKKTKKEVDKALFEKRQLKQLLQKQLDRSTLDEKDEFNLLS